jgi:hypothetical protein
LLPSAQQEHAVQNLCFSMKSMSADLVVAAGCIAAWCLGGEFDAGWGRGKVYINGCL